MKKLLIVEDDMGIRESLEDYFKSLDYLVCATADQRAAQAALSKQSFTLVLLDLRLPDGDGLDILKSMRRDGNLTPVIILTARGEEEQRIHGLELGADDYLSKPFSLHELSARIDAVLRRTGSAAFSFSLGKAEIDLGSHEILFKGHRHRLIQKEAELLAFLYKNPGQVFRREVILREVWGYDATPTTRTVDTHIFNLRKKIEEEPENPKHIVTVHRVGYRLIVEP